MLDLRNIINGYADISCINYIREDFIPRVQHFTGMIDSLMKDNDDVK